jgi:hypothetical protein
MATTKVTFTLDNLALQRLQDAADKLAKPKSAIVRDAILDYYDRLGHLTERERSAMLRAFDELVPKIPKRPAREAIKEIAAVRRARKAGGRRTPSDSR